MADFDLKNFTLSLEDGAFDFGGGEGPTTMDDAPGDPGIFLPNTEGRSEFLPPDPDRVPQMPATDQAAPEYAARPAADRIDELFSAHSIDRIYLNFSDPWPKARHAKRRLTYRSFLARYARVLREGGDLAIKTDNDGLFDFTLEELAEAGWTVLEQTRDLHASPYAEGNVMTEYEMAFSEKGKNINYVRALPPTEQTEHASAAPVEQTETAETAEAERA